MSASLNRLSNSLSCEPAKQAHRKSQSDLCLPPQCERSADFSDCRLRVDFCRVSNSLILSSACQAASHVRESVRGPLSHTWCAPLSHFSAIAHSRNQVNTNIHIERIYGIHISIFYRYVYMCNSTHILISAPSPIQTLSVIARWLLPILIIHKVGRQLFRITQYIWISYYVLNTKHLFLIRRHHLIHIVKFLLELSLKVCQFAFDFLEARLPGRKCIRCMYHGMYMW